MSTAHIHTTSRQSRHEDGLTLIEMMVTLLIGSFLVLGAITVFTQSRTSYRTTDSTSRLQENARFAMTQLEPDIRLAQFWGMTNNVRSIVAPAPLPAVLCGGNNASNWLLNFATPTLAPVQAFNSNYPLAGLCAPFNNAWRANTDSLVVRHASGQPTVPTAGVIQIQSSRSAGSIITNGAAAPVGGCLVPPCVQTFDLQVHFYYVDSQSSLGATTPSLRRLTIVGGTVQDQEIIAGVEDFQVQLGVDTNNDGTIERYVDPNHALVTVGAPGYNPAARILAARIWLLLRAERPEVGFTDNTVYQYANVPAFTRNDGFRRMLVSKTILLRNARGG